MSARRWQQRLRGVPVLGGIVEFLGLVLDVYRAIGWSDPTYAIRSGEERLTEARRIATMGDTPSGEEKSSLPALPADQQDAEEGDGSPGQRNR